MRCGRPEERQYGTGRNRTHHGKGGADRTENRNESFNNKIIYPKKTKFMMRKILSLFAIASMLVATSCSNEEFDSVKNGTEANVSFTAQLPEGLQTKMTRAYGKAELATNLTYAVYDENWELLKDLGGTGTLVNLQTTVNLTLVNGKTYNIVFWADSDTEAITFDQEEAKVEVDYNKITANSEKLDAFFSVEKITVSRNETKEVKLKRPFAQLNIGTADWEDVEKNGVTITQTGITVENIYNMLDFKTENVTGEATSVTFTPGELPNSDVFPAGEEYTYLSMNYLLVSMDKTSDNKVTINYDDVVEKRTFESVPLQRNYRTNIFGNLLTSQTEVNVTLDKEFDDSYDITCGSLDGIIEKVNNGEISEIYLTGNATITANQVLTKNLTIYGNGYTLTVDGYTWKGNTGVLTLDKVKVVDTESYDENGGWELTNLEINKVKATDCTFNNGLMISSNSEFTNCSFTESKSNQYAVWVSGGDVSFSDCTFQGARGLKVHNQYHDYTNGYTGTISVDNCKFFIESKPGVCFGTLQSSANVSITNSLFVCIAGDQSKYIYETDTDITTFTFLATNNTIATAVSTTDELQNALESDENANKTILLAANVEFEEITVLKIASNLTIEGDGETTIVKGIKVEETDIENLTLRGVVFENKGMWLNFTNTPHNKVEGLTMQNCTMKGSGQTDTQDGNRLFDIGTDAFGSNQLFDVTIEGCTVSNVYQGIRLGGLTGTTTIKNNTISNVGHNAITLRSTSAINSTILVENNVITNGTDRAFRIGTVNVGTVTYKNNTITNTGDTDGENFKANTINGTVTFEGNTVDGNAWGTGTYTSATSF